MIRKLPDIVCYEEGSLDASPCTLAFNSLRADIEALQRLAREGCIALHYDGSFVEIRGCDRVGLVVLPSGRRMVIRSKLPGVVILEWLAYLGEFPPLETWLPESGVTAGDDYHQCLARLFLYELERLTRLHLRKDYTPVAINDPVVRGRVLVSHMCRQLHRLPSIPQMQRSRTFNTPYNIVLALALDRLPVLLAGSSMSDRRRLARLRDLWANVQRQIPDAATAATEAQWAGPPGYRAALQLARLLLTGTALDPSTGMGGRAFTISLALVWERSLRRMFTLLEERTGWKSVPDGARTRQWDDSVGRHDVTRWLTADVIVSREKLRWVLDAKYKRAFGNESRVDRFQMCAYAVAFDSERATLVYPTSTGKPRRRVLLCTSVGGKEITVDSIELSMTVGPRACEEALCSICGGERLLQETREVTMGQAVDL